MHKIKITIGDYPGTLKAILYKQKTFKILGREFKYWSWEDQYRGEPDMLERKVSRWKIQFEVLEVKDETKGEK